MPDINPNGTVTCPDCRGTGDVGGNPSYGPCERCNRTGKITPQPMPDINKTDLVARLREHKFWSQTNQGTDHYEHDPICDEAADTIEALTADNRMKDELLTAAVDDYNKALGEISRLRDALTALADAGDVFGIRTLVAGWNGESDASGPHAPHPSQLGVKLPTNCGAVYAFDEASRRARTALESNHG